MKIKRFCFTKKKSSMLIKKNVLRYLKAGVDEIHVHSTTGSCQFIRHWRRQTTATIETHFFLIKKVTLKILPCLFNSWKKLLEQVRDSLKKVMDLRTIFFIPCGTYLFLEKNTGRQAVFCVTMLRLLYLATSAKCELSRVLSSGQKMRFISAYPTRFMNISRKFLLRGFIFNPLWRFFYS